MAPLDKAFFGAVVAEKVSLVLFARTAAVQAFLESEAVAAELALAEKLAAAVEVLAEVPWATALASAKALSFCRQRPP